MLSVETLLLSFIVTIIPSPVTSVNPKSMLFFFNCSSFSAEPSVFSLAVCLTLSSFFSADCRVAYVLSYLSFHFSTWFLKSLFEKDGETNLFALLAAFI